MTQVFSALGRRGRRISVKFKASSRVYIGSSRPARTTVIAHLKKYINQYFNISSKGDLTLYTAYTIKNYNKSQVW